MDAELDPRGRLYGYNLKISNHRAIIVKFGTKFLKTHQYEVILKMTTPTHNFTPNYETYKKVGDNCLLHIQVYSLIVQIKTANYDDVLMLGSF